jgi:hypothetical protein
MKFGVQLGIGNSILVGNINKKGTLFLQKEDKTVEVLQAVIDLIAENNKNNMTTELVSLDTRYILSLELKDI